MAIWTKSPGIDQLPFQERLSLAEETWDSIASNPAAFPPKDAQCAELDRRIAEHDVHPETGDTSLLRWR